MKITSRQLRQIIREAILLEQLPGDTHAGYMVPNFETEEDMMMFIDELEPDDEVMKDVVNPETGEVVIEAGQSPLEAGLVELEPEPEETDADEDDDDDGYDWDKWEREQEEKEAAKTKQYEDILARLSADAVAGGKDWAMDTMHDATNSPSMWQGGMNQHQSPEDYVLGFGQDAAGDLADALTRYNGDRDVQELWNELKDREGMGVYGGGYGRDVYNRPTKAVFKEIIADYFYSGISKGVEEYKQKYGSGS